MKTYGIYKARLHYHEYNPLIGTVQAYTAEQAKDIIQKDVLSGGMNINPFYVVIADITDGAMIIEHNKHMQFVGPKKEPKL
jgi:hypothetical protein